MTGLLLRRGILEKPHWTPQREPGLVLWLSAADEAVARGLAKADTAALDQWTDLSGQGNSPAQATGSKQPILQHDGTRWCVVWDAIDDLLQGAASPVAAGAARTIIVAGKAGASANGIAPVVFRTAVAVYFAELAWIVSAFFVYSDGSIANNNASISDQRTLIRSPFIASQTSGGTGTKIAQRLNGNAFVVTQVGSVGADTGTDGLSIGARPDAAFYPGGTYYGLLIYDRVLSSAEIQQAERFMNRAHALGLGV
ncbi:MAG: hypothetical protein NUW01_14180 [Gemmatimonadaceae bacterium]|nr:hypothetical protein [Gemmatimonadaceae bacterium]